MAQRKFDKDVELLKINLLAEEWRGDQVFKIGVYFSAMIGILIVVLQTPRTSLVADVSVALVVVGYFGAVAYFAVVRPYGKRISKLDDLLAKVEKGEPIGRLADLLKEKSWPRKL